MYKKPIFIKEIHSYVKKVFILKYIIMGKSIVLNAIIVFMMIALSSCFKEDSWLEEEIIDPKGIGPIEDGSYYVAPWGNDENDGKTTKCDC